MNTDLLNEEEKYKKSIYDKVRNVSSQQTEIIVNMQEACKFYLDTENSIPNIGFSLNNKIVELQREFSKAGISIYVKEDKTGNVNSSFVGEAIFSDLIDQLTEGTIELKNCTNFFYEKAKKQNNKMNVFRQIKYSLNPDLIKKDFCTDDEKEQIKSNLSNYKSFNDKIYNYNLKENIVSSIVKKIRDRGYHAYTVPGLLEEEVIPELEKLGLSNLIPELQNSLVKEYEQDINVMELSDEDKKLYVPNFKKPEQKKGINLDNMSKEQLINAKEQLNVIYNNSNTPELNNDVPQTNLPSIGR